MEGLGGNPRGEYDAIVALGEEAKVGDERWLAKKTIKLLAECEKTIMPIM